VKAVLKSVLDFFSSLGLSCALLILLALLTYLGTIDQVENGLFDAQKKYFESFIVWNAIGPFPLPGAYAVMSVLFVNLLLGGLVRIRKSWATAGVIIGHIGILMMLGAGLVKFHWSKEGHVLLYEGQSKSEFQSYYDWELVLFVPTANETLREYPIAPKDVEASTGEHGRVFRDPALPFELQVSHYMRNCRAMRKGPMFEVNVPVIEGVFLNEMKPEIEAEQNVAGVYVSARAPDGSHSDVVVQGSTEDEAPQELRIGGNSYGIQLRKQKFPMPFSVRLDKFTKENQPRIDMAKRFSSDVSISEPQGTRGVKISMNEPLRDKGLVLYQASWGPSNAKPGERLFSTLAVVDNPSDKWPLISCIVIAAGMLLHFSRKLVRHVRLEGSKA